MKLLLGLVALVALSTLVSAADKCSTFTDCISCAEYGKSETHLLPREKGCAWHNAKSECIEVNMKDVIQHKREPEGLSVWEDSCPVKAPQVDEFLANWMGKLMDIHSFKDSVFLDLSLPGTHDTLTYDLSLKTSDGGVDDHDKFAEELHKYSILVPNAAEDYLRQQAQTQDLDITAQLNNGIRFLDLRMMYEYTDAQPNWYSLHMLQSRKPMMTYLTEIRDWMVVHPSEIVVLWLSKHGSVCAKGESQYPNTPVDVKQAFWHQIEDLFGDMKVDTQQTLLNETSVYTMVEKNQRAVFYVTDYEEFAGNSQYALDGCLINNQLGPSVDDEVNAAQWEQNLFISATLSKWKLKANQGFLLMSMATGVPENQMFGSAALRFMSNKLVDKKATDACTESFNIPGFSGWCPPSLLDIANLENYYKQLTLQQCLTKMEKGWSFPNAIYLNGVDYGGRIRTGTTTLWGKDREGADSDHLTTGFAYVDTIVAANVYTACNPVSHHDIPDACEQLTKLLKDRVSAAPVSTWTDKSFGRLENWPNIDRGAD
jgi:hypothetical protein